MVLANLMTRRLALLDLRLEKVFSQSMKQAKLITGIPIILVGVRFLIEFLFHT